MSNAVEKTRLGFIIAQLNIAALEHHLHSTLITFTMISANLSIEIKRNNKGAENTKNLLNQVCFMLSVTVIS